MRNASSRGQGTTRRAVPESDARWAERWKRLGAANEAARRERLRSLTLEEALREFEDLCRKVHAAFDVSAVARSHPVGLVKYTRRQRGGS